MQEGKLVYHTREVVGMPLPYEYKVVNWVCLESLTDIQTSNVISTNNYDERDCTSAIANDHKTSSL